MKILCLRDADRAAGLSQDFVAGLASLAGAH